MKEYFPKYLHRFDVNDEDEYILFIIRYDKDINEDGIVLNSAQGFVNEVDARKAYKLVDEILRLTHYEYPTDMYYDACLLKKSQCFFIDGYWRPYINIVIENENDKII